MSDQEIKSYISKLATRNTVVDGVKLKEIAKRFAVLSALNKMEPAYQDGEMFCGNCHAPLDSAYTYCWNCGSRIKK